LAGRAQKARLAGAVLRLGNGTPERAAAAGLAGP